VDKLCYTSIEQQIKILKENGLKIKSVNRAAEYLNEVGYNKLINCYKWPFIDDNGFIFGTDIDDIYQLYLFDRELRALLLKYLFIFEVTMKVQMTEVISQNFGLDAKEYLDSKFYCDLIKKGKLIKFSAIREKIETELDRKKEQRAIKFYKDKYKQIPFWALANILSFGDMNSLFSLMLPEYQTRISRYWKQSPKFLTSALNVMQIFRNACAHNETIYNYKTFGYNLYLVPVKNFLEYFKIQFGTKETRKEDRNICVQLYKSGTRDLLALFFIFKIVLPKGQFKEFVEQYLSIYNNFFKKEKDKISADIMQKIICEINVPSNIRDLINL
jgi:abortive infection bacteriophage resistance protein